MQIKFRPSPNSKRHLLLILGGSTAILLGLTTKAMADTSLADLINIFNQYNNLANQYLQQITDTVSTVKSGNLQQILRDASGALGIPDPFEVADQVQTTVGQSDPGIGVNPVSTRTGCQKRG